MTAADVDLTLLEKSGILDIEENLMDFLSWLVFVIVAVNQLAWG